MQSAIYDVRLLREVESVLDSLETHIFFELARDIDSLAFAPRREDADELGEGFWLLRSGEFAIIYRIEETRLVVVLVKVGRQVEILEEPN
jgi:mRNA-degrading endonuclease RelE of RelBE toxin-antitoxin system